MNPLLQKAIAVKMTRRVNKGAPTLDERELYVEYFKGKIYRKQLCAALEITESQLSTKIRSFVERCFQNDLVIFDLKTK